MSQVINVIVLCVYAIVVFAERKSTKRFATSALYNDRSVLLEKLSVTFCHGGGCCSSSSLLFQRRPVLLYVCVPLLDRDVTVNEIQQIIRICSK